ncbi:hypothetical protein [Devosia sp.]|uniref:alpha/beta hydrolase n=1 Tax=Devosia sp. TaxID=1871048 RepID=UPI00261A8CCB|nr:hypothetical protein [Devosia sp.]
MRILRWLSLALALAAVYVIVAPFVLAFGLGGLLTAGVVDWAGYTRTPPDDPLTIGYRGDPGQAFGYAFETVQYATELGPAEAWVIPAAEPSPIWAIWVHGIGGLRENGYRIVKTLHEQGVPVLMITYRNDKGAPRSADGLYSFGLDEWRDLEAAVDWAHGQGAERIVIAAESMGAAITGQYLTHAADTRTIAGLALDAPALDFPAVIHAGGKRYWVPLSDLVATAGLEISTLFRRDLRQAVSLDAVAAFDGPIFVAHGTRDPLVPFSISERLVAKRPDILFWRTDADRHPMSFESDRAGYTEALRQWLAAVRQPAATGPNQ